MEKVDCPACAGPDNATCATCGGTSEVTQEVYGAFILEKEKREATARLQRALSMLYVESAPGQDKTIVIHKTWEDNIVATIDETTEMNWNDRLGMWE